VGTAEVTGTVGMALDCFGLGEPSRCELEIREGRKSAGNPMARMSSISAASFNQRLFFVVLPTLAYRPQKVASGSNSHLPSAYSFG
jgi:hypothetical protein